MTMMTIMMIRMTIYWKDSPPQKNTTLIFIKSFIEYVVCNIIIIYDKYIMGFYYIIKNIIIIMISV